MKSRDTATRLRKENDLPHHRPWKSLTIASNRSEQESNEPSQLPAARLPQSLYEVQ
jgi:hypothetical protein